MLPCFYNFQYDSERTRYPIYLDYRRWGRLIEILTEHKKFIM